MATTKSLKIAIVGFGRLGRACAENVRARHDLELVGVVVRSGDMPLPGPFGRLAVARHLRDLPRIATGSRPSSAPAGIPACCRCCAAPSNG